MAPRHRQRAARARRRARVHRLDPPRCAQGWRRHRLHDARPRRAARGRSRRAAPGRRVVTRETQYAGGRVNEAGAGRARRARSAHRRHPRARRRASQQARLQPRVQRDAASPARRSSRSSTPPRLRAGMTPATLVDDEPVEVAQGRKRLAPGELRRQLHRHDHAREGARRLVERRRGAREPDGRASRTSSSAARRNGITSPLPNYPAIALGAVDVTPLELVAAYAPFANGGLRVHPRLVRRIEAADGTVLWSAEIAPADTVMDPRDAYQLTSMLRGVVDNGTARTIRDDGRAWARSPARRARRTTPTTSGSSATRRRSSPASGSATTRRARSRRTRRADTSPRRRGPSST